MSQIFTLHDAKCCENCNEVMTKIGINKYICLSCRNIQDDL